MDLEEFGCGGLIAPRLVLPRRIENGLPDVVAIRETILEQPLTCNGGAA